MSDHPKLILFVRDVCGGEQYELTENSLSEFYVTPEKIWHSSSFSLFSFLLVRDEKLNEVMRILDGIEPKELKTEQELFNAIAKIVKAVISLGCDNIQNSLSGLTWHNNIWFHYIWNPLLKWEKIRKSF